MKRGLMLAFAILMLMPFVSATISIDGPSKLVYNLGDNVEISGYVASQEGFTGFLGLALDCSGSKFQFPLTALSLDENEKKDLKTDIQLPKITIPSSITGVCSLDVSMMSGSSIVESAKSKEFEVKKELKGSFSIDTNKIQIGKTFRLTGNIYKLDGKNTDGGAEIYFENKDTRFLVDIASTENGKLDYTYKAIQIPEGDYKIVLLVNDVYGNSQLFEDVAEFTLINQIHVSAKADKTSLNPEEKLKIYGDVKSQISSSLIDGTVKMVLDGDEYSSEIKNSKFEYTIQLSSSIKSGSHRLDILAEDKEGNKGNTAVDIYINPIQTELKLRLNKDSIEPKEDLEITPLLYDQANDIIPEDVSIEVYNAKDSLVFTDAVKSGSTSRFKVPDSALPGQYTIKLGSKKLKAKASFQVIPLNDLDIGLNGQSLDVKNIGNIEFKGPIKIVFDPNQITAVKKVSLKPGKETSFDLSTEVNSGVYNIRVLYSNKEKEFKDVSITAKPRKSLNTLYYMLAVLFFFLAIYLSYIKIVQSRKKKMKDEYDRMVAKKDIKRIREIKSTPEGISHKSRFSHRNVDREQAIADFKHSYVNKLKEPEEKEGMFNLFDR